MTPPRPRVLIVEDSPEDAEVFRDHLERPPDGFACTVAASGEAGLECLARDAFDCVLLDHQLPDLSGLEFLASFAPDAVPCAVVMLTGLGDESLAVAALKAGAEDYLTKSRLSREHLRQSVRNAIGRFDLKHRLERERRRNEAILASIDDAFFALDRQWRLTYANPAGERLLGRPAAALAGQSLWATFPALSGTAFEAQLRRAASDGQPPRFESAWPGAERWLEVRVYPSTGGISVYAADVTDRRRDEERRRLLETVALEANDAIIITEAAPLEEPGPRILYVNPAFERLSGYAAAEVLGRSPRFLQGPGSEGEGLGRIRAALKAFSPVEAEVLNYRQDGTPFWVELSISPVADASGWFTHWVSVQRDITERKRIEAELLESVAHHRHSIELNPQVPWTADPEGNILDFNERWLELTGMKRHEAEGAGWPSAVHPDDAPGMFQAWSRSILTGEPYDIEHRIRLADGSHRWMHSRAFPRRDDAGRIVRWYGTTEDIQQRKESQAALQASEESLRQLAEAQRRFVSDASHELRAPLTAMRGNLGILLRYDDIPEDERHQMLTDAERETERLSRLITDLLHVARGDAGQYAAFRPVRLDALLAETARGARHLAADHRLECADLPEVAVLGDADRLKQLAFVLLENALKYTPGGGVVRLTLTLEGGSVWLRVADNGPGIAPEDLGRVFERFYRADPARTPGRDPGGTGLGLPIAKLIAEAHGGAVWLESQQGAGTTAVVRLPLAEQPPAD